MIENQEKLAGNPRMAMPYRTLTKMDNDKRGAIKSDAARTSNSLKRIDPMLRKIGIFHKFLGKSREGMLIRVLF